MWYYSFVRGCCRDCVQFQPGLQRMTSKEHLTCTPYLVSQVQWQAEVMRNPIFWHFQFSRSVGVTTRKLRMCLSILLLTDMCLDRKSIVKAREPLPYLFHSCVHWAGCGSLNFQSHKNLRLSFDACIGVEPSSIRLKASLRYRFPGTAPQLQDGASMSPISAPSFDHARHNST